MSNLLVIDLGTSYFKVSLFDSGGRLTGLVRIEAPLDSATERCQIDPAAFRNRLAEAIGRLAEQTPGGLSRVEAVSFASQTNSFTLLDEKDRPLVPLILWPDRRALDCEDAVRAWSAEPGFAARTGIPRASHQFMAAKLLWLRWEQPDAWRRARRLCMISDYLTLLLTGRRATEAGAVGLTGLIDIHTLDFHPPSADRFGLDASWLSEVVRAGTDLGPLLPEACNRLGLPAKCRFVVGCLDQYAGAIGVGACRSGAVSQTTGTVLATVRCTDRFLSPGGEIFVGPAFAPGLYYEMAFGDVSANYLEWYRRQLPDAPPFEQLLALAAAVEPGAGGLRPATARPPTTIEAVFPGLRSEHGRGHCVRAILEAVAAALREQVSALSGGALPAVIRCAGGGAASRLWLSIMADMLDVAMHTTDCPEPTSLGAAALAQSALGGTAVADIATAWARDHEVCEPNAERVRRYAELYPRRFESREDVV